MTALDACHRAHAAWCATQPQLILDINTTPVLNRAPVTVRLPSGRSIESRGPTSTETAAETEAPSPRPGRREPTRPQ